MPNKISFFVMPRQARRGGWTALTHMRVSPPSASIETFESKVSFRPHGNVDWQGFFPIGNKKLCRRLVSLEQHRKHLGFKHDHRGIHLWRHKELGALVVNELGLFTKRDSSSGRGIFCPIFRFQIAAVFTSSTSMWKLDFIQTNGIWTQVSWIAVAWLYSLAILFGLSLYSRRMNLIY